MKPRVELVYQDEQGRIIVEYIAWFKDMRVADVLKMPQYVDLRGRKFGIFSNLVSEDYLLSENDRLEFYKPLKIDPKDARRLRAKKKKTS